MTDQPGDAKGSGFQDFGKQIDEHLNEVLPRVQQELKKVVAYLNDDVIPKLRQESSQTLRATAEQLRHLADYLDDRRAREGN